ncbi:NAD(P)H-binding protein [Nonomuraea purpurea]|uniref:NAD(P)H-binding protein n=1 Tax=Nonomuraea purpurea TaxID=1849276 RepID=A0ABV8GQP9_9ACTN
MSTYSSTAALVLGGTGKTGARVARRLTNLGYAVRVGSRSTTPPFSWEDPSTWGPALQGVDRVYIVHAGLGSPESVGQVRDFTRTAVQAGVHRMVMLTGGGSAEFAQAEDAVRTSGAEWTILRPNWFNQNFDEDLLTNTRQDVRAGEVVGSYGASRFAFVDCEDIADVAAAALTGQGHHGKTYDITGPRLMTFAQAVAEIAAATGRPITYTDLTGAQYRDHLIARGMPVDVAQSFDGDFPDVDSELTTHVHDVLGRPAKDFTDYARQAAATGVWDA